MKKILFLFCILSITLSACDLAVTIAPSVQPTLPSAIPTSTPANTFVAPTVEPATPTPEIFIGLTQAIPPTTASNPTAIPTAIQPPVSDGTTVTYSPLTITIPQAIASGASGRDFPRLDGDDAAWWQKTPGHLQVSLGDYYALQGKTHLPAIYVYPASAYVELVPAAFESIHRLQNYLYAPNNVPALDQLPGVPFFNAQILFAAHIQPVSFQNGKGIRYISEYAQYPASANNTDLFYNFIGVSGDGVYYIVAIFPLTSPMLAETSDGEAPLPAGGIPYPYFADPNANMAAYYIAVTDLLNVTPADTFFPAIFQLDALIQSMQIAQ
jgi:hypothetical protein